MIASEVRNLTSESEKLDYFRQVVARLQDDAANLVAAGEDFPALWRNALRLEATLKMMSLELADEVESA
ncbi:MAG: hypothetical protein HQK60_03770 [Deltaproteobacteria bacterium]|nr:hypothetical protein [Deltaproteobacteria bacterium]